MFSFCGDIVVLNETVVHVVYMHFLFLNQSWSTIKKIASIKGTSLIKTDVIGSKKNSLLTVRVVNVFTNAWLKLVKLLPCFSWSRYNVIQKRSSSQNFQNIFVFISWWLSPPSYMIHTGWWQKAAEKRNNEFLKNAIF